MVARGCLVSVVWLRGIFMSSGQGHGQGVGGVIPAVLIKVAALLTLVQSARSVVHCLITSFRLHPIKGLCVCTALLTFEIPYL